MIRHNRFNEPYCTDVADVKRQLEMKEFSPAMVYAVEIAGAPGELPAIEVLENIDGETVLYIEGPTFEACRAIAKDAEIQMEV